MVWMSLINKKPFILHLNNELTLSHAARRAKNKLSQISLRKAEPIFFITWPRRTRSSFSSLLWLLRKLDERWLHESGKIEIQMAEHRVKKTRVRILPTGAESSSSSKNSAFEANERNPKFRFPNELSIALRSLPAYWGIWGNGKLVALTASINTTWLP